MGPFAEESLETQQHIKQKGNPDLPAHGVGGIAQEVAQLKRLLDLLEEDLDFPAAAIEVGDCRRCPVEIVGQKLHDREFAIEFNLGGNAAQPIGVLPTRELYSIATT